MKKCSTSLTIWEIQVKPQWDTISHLLEWLLSKKTRNNKCWGCGAKGTLAHCWWECKLTWPLWKTLQWFFKKIETELQYDVTILLLGVFLKKTKPLSQKDKCIPLFSEALFTIAKVCKPPKCPSIMNKENVVYVYVFIYI